MTSTATRIGSLFAQPGSRFLAKSTLVSISAQVASVACSAVLGVFLARYLGAAGYGDFTYAYTLLLIAVIPAKLGLDTTAMKLIAAYEQQHDHARTHGLLSYTTRRTLMVGTTVGLVSLALVLSLKDSLHPHLYWSIFAAAVCVPALSLLQLLQYMLYGLRRYVLAMMPESILRPLLLILCVYAAGKLFEVSSAAHTMFLNVALTCILAGYAFVSVRKLLPKETFSTPPHYEIEAWKRTGGAMLMISGLNFILAQTDIVLLGIFAGTYESGLYAAASRIALLVLFFYTAVNSVAAPVIARSFAANDNESLCQLSSTCGRAILALTLLLAAGSILFGRSLLWLFGEAFVSAYPVLVILSVAQIAKALSGVGGFLLTMTKHESESARLSFAGAICNFVVALLVIPKFGAVGAAYSTLLATVVWSFGVILIVKKRLGIFCWS